MIVDTKSFLCLLVISLLLFGVFVFQFVGDFSTEPTIEVDNALINDDLLSTLQTSTEEIPAKTEKDFDITQRKRKAWLIEACKHIPHTKKLYTNNLLRHLLVDEKQRLMFCYIAKIACTSWKGVFIRLSGKVANSTNLSPGFIHGNNKILRNLKSFPPNSYKRRIQNYKSFIFVREPFERLLSAYINKFATPGSNLDFHRIYGRRIIKTFRTNASEESLKRGDDVTFPEFVKFLLSRGKQRVQLNEHWERYNLICNPCNMKYDYIGKYETVEEDADIILKRLGVDDLVQFPRRSGKSASLVKEYYSKINKEDLKQLWNQYKIDYFMWNYPKPSFIDAR